MPVMTSTYDLRLVALSISIAFVASYTALDLAGRVTAARGRAKIFWLMGGAALMGIGIWSMHFVAMLAYKLPVSIAYDVPTVLLSMLAAIVASVVALWLAARPVLNWCWLLSGGVFMGLAIASMHYTGMVSMRLHAIARYNWSVVALSVAIAISASFAALCLAFRLREITGATGIWLKLASATIMGAAISGMHYTGMAAVCFEPQKKFSTPLPNTLDTSLLATAIGITTLIILGLTLLTSLFDRLFAAQVAKADAQIRTLLREMPVGVLLLNPNLEVILTNSAACELLGRSEAQLYGNKAFDTDWEIIQEDGTRFESVRRPVQQAIANRHPVRNVVMGVYRPFTRDWVWLLVNAEPQTAGEDGMPEQVICSFSDITKRKQTQEALRKSEQRLSLLFQQTPVAAIERNLNLEVTEWNPAAERIFGFSKSEVIGRNVLELIVPESARKHVDKIYDSILTGTGGERSINEDVTKDGRTIICEWYNTPLVDPNGNPIGIASLVQDVTYRVQAEEALRESQQRFRRLSEATFEGIVVHKEGKIIDANQAAATLLGYEVCELICMNCLDLVTPESQAVVEKNVLSEDKNPCEAVGVKKDGATFPIEIQSKAIPYQGDMLKVTALRDITERKQVEEARKERSRLSLLTAEVGVILSAPAPLPEILHLCTEALVQHLNAVGAYIWIFNSAANQLELQAMTEQETPAVAIPTHIPFQQGWGQGHGTWGMGHRQEIPFPIPHAPNPTPVATTEGKYATRWLHFVRDPNSPIPNSQFPIAYPLIVEERLVGLMALRSRQPFTETVRSMLGWVKNALALAIDRAWAREELLSRREALLFHLANQIRNSLDVDTILETTVQEIRSLLQIDRCHFIWYRNAARPEWEVVKEARDSNCFSLIGRYSFEEVGPLANKLLDLEIVRVDDVSRIGDPKMKQLLLSRGFTSVLALPIQTGGDIGVVSCSHGSQVRPWSDSEVELLKAVTVQLAIAIDQAELYNRACTAANLAQTKAEELSSTLQKLQQTQTQLIQTERMSGLGQLVAGIAHEINNPINFINGNLAPAKNYIQDLLELYASYKQHYPNPPAAIVQQEAAIDLEFIISDLPMLLSSMQLGADRIRSIVLSLRNFSRLDEAEMKPVDLHQGIDNTLLILQHRFKPSSNHCPGTRNVGIQVIKEYGNLPLVECYAGQLNQVFMNILSNAIDALEEGIENQESGMESKGESSNPQFPIPTIWIRTFVASPDSVAVCIADNGPGMTENVKMRLFDPFFTTKPVGQGTGLGLSICYQIVVEKHRGELKCLSEPGKGAEFWLEIPIVSIPVAIPVSISDRNLSD